MLTPLYTLLNENEIIAISAHDKIRNCRLIDLTIEELTLLANHLDGQNTSIYKPVNALHKLLNRVKI